MWCCPSSSPPSQCQLSARALSPGCWCGSPAQTPGGGFEWPLRDQTVCLSIKGRKRAAANLDAVRAMSMSAVSASSSLSPLLQVLYRWNRQSSTSVIETNKTSVELSLPFDEDYIIEIKPFSDGGDGSSSEQIRIPKISSKDGRNWGSVPAPPSAEPQGAGVPSPSPHLLAGQTCFTPIAVGFYKRG